MPKVSDPHRRLRDALRKRRKALDFSVSDVAQATGVGASRIRRIEEDAENAPRLIQIARLAVLYGMTAEEVFSLIDLPERLSAATQPPEQLSSSASDDEEAAP